MSQQIRIALHHDGTIGAQLSIPPPAIALLNGTSVNKNTIHQQLSKKQDIEDFMNDIWNMFGTVTKVTYHKSYTSCVLTFQNHYSAVFAFAAINDPIQFQVAMQSAIGGDVRRAQYAKSLFQPVQVASSSLVDTYNVRICTPTWVD
jgi:hypothetical protein